LVTILIVQVKVRYVQLVDLVAIMLMVDVHLVVHHLSTIQVSNLVRLMDVLLISLVDVNNVQLRILWYIMIVNFLIVWYHIKVNVPNVIPIMWWLILVLVSIKMNFVGNMIVMVYVYNVLLITIWVNFKVSVYLVNQDVYTMIKIDVMIVINHSILMVLDVRYMVVCNYLILVVVSVCTLCN
jgi:hypothetical protein